MSKVVSTSFALFGFALSLYAVHVEMHGSKDESFSAYCDISPQMSCTKVFTSEYGHIWSHLGLVPKSSFLDQPNAAYGAVFYLVMAYLFLFTHKPAATNAMLVLSSASLILSSYLAYILAFVLHDVCIVCVSSYVCNFALFGGSCYRAIREDTVYRKRSSSSGGGGKSVKKDN